MHSMPVLPVATIGFTKTTAEHFFERLRAAQVKRVVDVRLHNTSQLAGFAKADNLAWFLRVIGGMDYVHEPLLAPTDEILRPYKSGKGKWEDYAQHFLALMAERRIEERLPRALFDGACLLCSEHLPHHCHRKLVCDYLNEKWDGALAVTHL